MDRLKKLRRALFPRCVINLIPARFMLSILVLIGCFNIYTLRVTLNVAIVTMTDKSTKDHFAWDAKEKGLIISAFYYSYVPMNFFGGRFAEICGGNMVFGLGVLLTSILTLLTPLAADCGIYAVIALRIFEGLFEGISVPAMYTIFGRWFPKSGRTFLRALCDCGFDLGYILGNPLTAFLCSSQEIGGWRTVFYSFGVLGIIWYAFWCIMVYETPEDHPFISQKELEYILQDQGKETAYKNPPAPWYHIFTSIPIWALCISSLVSSLINQFIREDFNIFLKEVMNYDIKNNGFWSVLPYAMNLPVILITGYVMDRLIMGYPNRRTCIRKGFSLAGNVISVLSLVGVVLVGHNPVIVIILLSIAYGLGGGLDFGGMSGTIVDMSPVFAGSIYGIINGLGNINGIVAPLLVGHITEGRESSLEAWYLVFYIGISAKILAQVIFLLFGTSELQPWGLGVVHTQPTTGPLIKLQHMLRRRRYSLNQTHEDVLNGRDSSTPKYSYNSNPRDSDFYVSSEGIQP